MKVIACDPGLLSFKTPVTISIKALPVEAEVEMGEEVDSTCGQYSLQLIDLNNGLVIAEPSVTYTYDETQMAFEQSSFHISTNQGEPGRRTLRMGLYLDGIFIRT